MASSIEIARAFFLAKHRSHWPRRRLAAYHRRHVQLEGCVIETADEFERCFAERNVLGLTIAQAREEASRELAGRDPRFPGYSFGFSTGSTGQPGVFLTSEKERSRWVGTVLARFLPLRMLSGADIALVLKHNNRLYTDVDGTRRLRLHFFDVSAPLAEWVDPLCRLAPEVLIGPASLLESIAATEAFAKRPFHPALLIAGAEPMFPQDAAFLTNAYSVAPRVIYQAKEGFLAAGCPSGQLHWNEDLIYFERLELGAGRFAPIITDFTRLSQTYRRFRMDDILVAGPNGCACGQPFAALSAVEGRAQDVLLLDGGAVLLFPFQVNEAVRPHLKSTPAGPLADFCVTQLEPDHLVLAIEGGSSEEGQEAAREALASLVHPARVAVADYTAVKPGEKRRRVKRLFDPHNAWLNRFTVSTNALAGS